MSKNGNGHRGFWNRVKVFIRTISQFWEKEDKVSRDTYLVDSEVVKKDLGYYIANILDKKYYYCGTEWEDVKTKLKELGIGRDDPMADY